MPLPSMKSVNSTNLTAVGYDPEERRLYVKFKGQGAVYSYSDVSSDKHQQLLDAKSPGGFFYEHIRGVHEHKRHEVD